jgi:hypothetical protein
MIHKLLKGGRLRIRPQRRVSGYRHGDKGTVLRGPKKSLTGDTYLIVRMDKNAPVVWTFLSAEDVEPDT